MTNKYEEFANHFSTIKTNIDQFIKEANTNWYNLKTQYELTVKKSNTYLEQPKQDALEGTSTGISHSLIFSSFANYPTQFPNQTSSHFDVSTGTLLIDKKLPNLDAVDLVKLMSGTIRKVNKADLKRLKKVCLRRSFEDCSGHLKTTSKSIKAVCFNGDIEFIDPSDGIKKHK